MKGFERKNQLFSLCGLNCGLCPMFLGKHCGGCGNGNQSCGIAKCSLEHGKIEYCYECESYPCEKYRYIDKYDSFITHKRQKADLKMIQDIGVEQYNLQQREKMQILLVIGSSAIYCIVKALWQSLLILVVLGIATIAAVFLLVWAVMKVENIGESLGTFIRS